MAADQTVRGMRAQVLFYEHFQNHVPDYDEFNAWMMGIDHDLACGLEACFEDGDTGFMGDTLLVKLDEWSHMLPF